MSDTIQTQAQELTTEQMLQNMLAFISRDKKLMTVANNILDNKPPTRVNTKQYRHLTEVINCLHCGGVKTVDVTLRKDETRTVIDKEGNSTIIRYKDIEEPLTINTYTSSCPECRKLVNSWSRFELEEQYLWLLDRVGDLFYRDNKYMKQVAVYKPPISAIQMTGDDPTYEDCWMCRSFDEDAMKCRRLGRCAAEKKE